MVTHKFWFVVVIILANPTMVWLVVSGRNVTGRDCEKRIAIVLAFETSERGVVDWRWWEAEATELRPKYREIPGRRSMASVFVPVDGNGEGILTTRRRICTIVVPLILVGRLVASPSGLPCEFGYKWRCGWIGNYWSQILILCVRLEFVDDRISFGQRAENNDKEIWGTEGGRSRQGDKATYWNGIHGECVSDESKSKRMHGFKSFEPQLWRRTKGNWQVSGSCRTLLKYIKHRMQRKR